MIIDRIDEEFLLFALDTDGHWAPQVSRTLTRGLAAAWLAELMVEGRLRLHEGRVHARTKSPIGDQTLDWVLEMLRKPRRPKRLRRWVRRLARRARPHIPAVMERLHGRGYVDVVQRGRTTLYPSHVAGARQQLREHLRMVLFGQRGLDDSSLALLAVLDGAGLVEHTFGSKLAAQCSEQVDKLLLRDHRFYAIRGVIRRRKRKKAAKAA